MVFIFLLCVGLCTGIAIVLSTQFPTIRKRKYGYSKKNSFDFTSTISSDILKCNQDDQHANKEEV